MSWRHFFGRRWGLYGSLLLAFWVVLCWVGAVEAASKSRILVISSYHREYLWSRETHRGVCAALRQFGYLDDEAQVESFTRTDQVESSRAVIKKLWMDSKRRGGKAEIAGRVAEILEEAQRFQPDLLLLGDDNAAHYIGTQYLDTRTPVVFWGVNIWPLKYGLLDSIERPGHNVTGVYQSGYMREGLEFLVKLQPQVKTLAILADESETSLAKIKELLRLQEADRLPVRIVGSVVTNREEVWKAGALEMAERADAIFLTNHNTIRDHAGKPVDQLVLGAWYLRHVRKPDIGDEKQFVEEGVLCTADDSGFKQGFEAVRMADQILAHGASPAGMPPIAPERGALIVNLERARMLGIEEAIRGHAWIEETIDSSEALKSVPESP